jgi:hypothetical protein
MEHRRLRRLISRRQHNFFRAFGVSRLLKNAEGLAARRLEEDPAAVGRPQRHVVARRA